MRPAYNAYFGFDEVIWNYRWIASDDLERFKVAGVPVNEIQETKLKPRSRVARSP